MRRTLHLVSAHDCLRLRRLHDPMLVARMRGTLGRRLPGVDEEELAAAGRPLFAATPSTLTEVARAVGDRWPQVAARDLGDALSTLLPLVQVPPRGLWRQSAPASSTTIDVWLGAEPEDATTETAEALVLRYLAAYGPAATADIRAWSGLAGLPAVVARLRPQLRTFRDERGRALHDVPGAPLPDPDTPAPPRFLPAFDNAVLAFDDRRRIVDDADRGLSVLGTALSNAGRNRGGAGMSRVRQRSAGHVVQGATALVAERAELRTQPGHHGGQPVNARPGSDVGGRRRAVRGEVAEREGPLGHVSGSARHVDRCAAGGSTLPPQPARRHLDEREQGAQGVAKVAGGHLRPPSPTPGPPPSVCSASRRTAVDRRRRAPPRRRRAGGGPTCRACGRPASGRAVGAGAGSGGAARGAACGA